MAFWGAVVKPKKSFTLKFSEFEGPKLHLSQATLGTKKSKESTIVKCAVADRPVVYICSLLPRTAETCSLDLYFEEDVTFSVKGDNSVHLVGYFEGTFDGNDFDEDVEEDGYSEEEDEEASEDDSMNDFIDDDEEDSLYNEGWSSEEEQPSKVPKSGVIITELTEDEVLQDPASHDSKREAESHEASLVPANAIVKKERRDGSGVRSCSLKSQRDSTTGSLNGAKGQSQEIVVVSDHKHGSSSEEDEDGFRLNGKRKLREPDIEQPSKKKSPPLQTESSEPINAPAGEPETNLESKLPKKKKKKKKKGKNAAEDQAASPTLQSNTSTAETPIKKGDRVKSDKVEKHEITRGVVDGEEPNFKKKGTVRKHLNGLEVENTSMGKPDGKQAAPGRKIGMIYTGKLRSTGKIFDSNVGRKPLFFRLGVGEVIKGWDIGVNGMRVGDKRRLTIPPAMGYGSKGVPGIPPNSWLVFDVELVEVK